MITTEEYVTHMDFVPAQGRLWIDPVALSYVSGGKRTHDLKQQRASLKRLEASATMLTSRRNVFFTHGGIEAIEKSIKHYEQLLQDINTQKAPIRRRTDPQRVSQERTRRREEINRFLEAYRQIHSTAQAQIPERDSLEANILGGPVERVVSHVLRKTGTKGPERQLLYKALRYGKGLLSPRKKLLKGFRNGTKELRFFATAQKNLDCQDTLFVTHEHQ